MRGGVKSASAYSPEVLPRRKPLTLPQIRLTLILGPVPDVRPDLVRISREHSIRCTQQRYAVMDYLVRQHGHATADEIFRAVNVHHPRVSRATVYNNVRFLV